MAEVLKTITPVDGSVYVERPLAGEAEIDAAPERARPGNGRFPEFTGLRCDRPQTRTRKEGPALAAGPARSGGEGELVFQLQVLGRGFAVLPAL